MNNHDEGSAPAAAAPAKKKFTNFLTIGRELQDNALTRGIAAFNEFTYEITLTRPIPRAGRRATDFKPRPWADIDDTALAEHLNSRGFPRVTTKMIHDVINLLARDNPYHPVRDYLSALQWDGTHRLSGFFIKYCGAVIHGDKDEERAKSRDYVQAVTRKSFISCVARVFKPGCQVDTMPILEGKQAKLKSSLLRTIAVRDEWFSDDPPVDLSTKDAKGYMNGIWISEMQELAPFRKSGPKAVKAFLTTRTDKYRPAYGRRDIQVPRQSVFWGTTNQEEYLSDTTGNRRFWPIKITKVDLAGIRKVIDQIWAEAVAAYRGGEEWWFAAELEEVAAEEQSVRLEGDPWHPLISDFVANVNCITTTDVLDHLTVDRSRRERAHQMRVGNILRALGFERTRQGSGEKREYRYCRTAKEAARTVEEAAATPDAATGDAEVEVANAGLGGLDAPPVAREPGNGSATPVLPREHPERVCAQCNAADEPMIPVHNGNTLVFLHKECIRFWQRTNDGEATGPGRFH